MEQTTTGHEQTAAGKSRDGRVCLRDAAFRRGSGRVEAGDLEVAEIVSALAYAMLDDGSHLRGVAHGSQIEKQLVRCGGRRVQIAFNRRLLIVGAESGFHESAFRLDDGFEMDDRNSTGDQLYMQMIEQRTQHHSRR